MAQTNIFRERSPYSNPSQLRFPGILIPVISLYTPHIKWIFSSFYSFFVCALKPNNFGFWKFSWRFFESSGSWTPDPDCEPLLPTSRPPPQPKPTSPSRTHSNLQSICSPWATRSQSTGDRNHPGLQSESKNFSLGSNQPPILSTHRKLKFNLFSLWQSFGWAAIVLTVLSDG